MRRSLVGDAVRPAAAQAPAPGHLPRHRKCSSKTIALRSQLFVAHFLFLFFGGGLSLLLLLPLLLLYDEFEPLVPLLFSPLFAAFFFFLLGPLLLLE